MPEHSEADKAIARKNGEKVLRALWDCMAQLGAVPVALVVATFDDQVSAITPQGLTGIVPLKKWIEIWPGGTPSSEMVGKLGTE